MTPLSDKIFRNVPCLSCCSLLEIQSRILRHLFKMNRVYRSFSRISTSQVCAAWYAWHPKSRTAHIFGVLHTVLNFEMFSHALTEECEGVIKQHFPVSQTVSQETGRAMSAVAPLCGFPTLCCWEWKGFRGCTHRCEQPAAACSSLRGSKLPHGCRFELSATHLSTCHGFISQVRKPRVCTWHGIFFFPFHFHFISFLHPSLIVLR